MARAIIACMLSLLAIRYSLLAARLLAAGCCYPCVGLIGLLAAGATELASGGYWKRNDLEKREAKKREAKSGTEFLLKFPQTCALINR